MATYAQHFYEIEETVANYDRLRQRAVSLVQDEPIPGKATEGGNRVDTFRDILVAFFEGELTFQGVKAEISKELPQRESPHSNDNRYTFSSGWEERLARTQISRFYNKAALGILSEEGHSKVFIPHSDHEDRDSQCTLYLAGGSADIDLLLDRLDRAYRKGDWHEQPMIPDHPHCTHTVTPVEQ